MHQSTERFSNRVANYIRYRPHYPHAIIECLRTHCQLTADAVVADIGSGTGILAELFLRNGNQVYGVEPNRDMREAGERLLQPYANFTSVTGTAEATTLAASSVDFVTVGQAFHWFERNQAKAEFRRVLKPQGWVVLVWNDRREAAAAFGQDYERLLRTYATDYTQVNHKRIDDTMLGDFFGTDFGLCTFENSQHFDAAGLQGRLLSSSYAPEVGHPQHAAMMAELRRIFAAQQVDGTVTFEYDTNVFYGRLG